MNLMRKESSFQGIGLSKGELLEKVMLECQRCLELKEPIAFYLKSAIGEVPERGEKFCKTCKKDHKKQSQSNYKENNLSSVDGVEEILSVFLKLRQWRDEREGVVKVSNQDNFDIKPRTTEKRMWRDYA